MKVLKNKYGIVKHFAKEAYLVDRLCNELKNSNISYLREYKYKNCVFDLVLIKNDDIVAIIGVKKNPRPNWIKTRQGKKYTSCKIPLFLCDGWDKTQKCLEFCNIIYNKQDTQEPVVSKEFGVRSWDQLLSETENPQVYKISINNLSFISESDCMRFLHFCKNNNLPANIATIKKYCIKNINDKYQFTKSDYKKYNKTFNIT
jgi:hypothetical protein